MVQVRKRLARAQRARMRAATEQGNALSLWTARSRPRPSCARSSAGFSLIELLIVIAIILIILSIALPQMSKSRMHAQEMAAIEEIHTINQAEVQYQSQFGQFATSLNQLGPPTSAGAAEGPQAAGLIPSTLAAGSASGYNFTLTQTPQGYAINAVPKAFGSTGRRTFYSDPTGIVRENWGQDPATAASPELK